MIKLQIYQFTFFGKFAELLAYSKLLAALLNAASNFYEGGTYVLLSVCSNAESNYLPRYKTRQVIFSRI